MAVPYFRSIDLRMKELLNLRLQHISGDHPQAVSGTVHFDSAANRAALHNGTATKRLAFTDDVQTPDQTLAQNAIAETAGAGSWPDGFTLMSATGDQNWGPNTGEAGMVRTDRHSDGAIAVQYFTRSSDGFTYIRTWVSSAWTAWINFLRSDQLGAANGVATLDGSGDIPDGQIPDNIARDTEVQAAIDALTTGAPAALNTLDELAAALGDDANFASTITNLINARATAMSWDVGDGSALTFTKTHNKNTRALVPVLTLKASPWTVVGAEIDFPSLNTVRVQFDAPAPATDEFVLTVVGVNG